MIMRTTKQTVNRAASEALANEAYFIKFPPATGLPTLEFSNQRVTRDANHQPTDNLTLSVTNDRPGKGVAQQQWTTHSFQQTNTPKAFVGTFFNKPDTAKIEENRLVVYAGF